MTTIDSAALRRLALKATPGPWADKKNLDWIQPLTEVRSEETGQQVTRLAGDQAQYYCTIGKSEREWANAAYIAAANPAAILDLLDHIDAMSARVEAAEKDAARYRFMMSWQESDTQPQEIIDMWRKVYAEHRLKPCRNEYEYAIDAAIATQGATNGK